jgi:hypothetical protein
MVLFSLPAMAQSQQFNDRALGLQPIPGQPVPAPPPPGELLPPPEIINWCNRYNRDPGAAARCIRAEAYRQPQQPPPQAQSTPLPRRLFSDDYYSCLLHVAHAVVSDSFETWLQKVKDAHFGEVLAISFQCRDDEDKWLKQCRRIDTEDNCNSKNLEHVAAAVAETKCIDTHEAKACDVLKP